MLEQLTWNQFLRRWSREAIAHADAVRLEVTADMRASGWIGDPPASESDISNTEQRLAHALPPSYREFLAITNGWPVLSFDFGRVRPVAQLDWMAEADPGLYDVLCESDDYEWPPDSDDGPPLANRALVLSTGTDSFLFDTGRIDPNGEWATTWWTSWNPGAGHQRPSFRAGLEHHYANFVRFHAPDSITHAEVAERVEDAYQRSLRGDRAGEGTISEARSFGSPRADVLEQQIDVLLSKYHAETRLFHIARNHDPEDPALRADLWPMCVSGALDPRHRSGWHPDRATGPAASLLRSLADQYQRDGGLTADFGYAPAFAAAVEGARELARAGRDAEAWDVILRALPSWQPLSPLHLAPMGLLWDRDLGRVMTRQRRERLLATARGTGRAE